MKRIYIFKILFLLLLLCSNTYSKGENPVKTEIQGHWNYPDYSVQTVYVVSEGEDVELLINGISFGHGKQDIDSLYRFDNVIFVPGDLTAVSYDGNGKELSRQTLQSAGAPAQLMLKVKENCDGFSANGNDLAIIQFDIADFQGKRCGADDRLVTFEIEGPAEWIGNVSEENAPNNNKVIKAKNGTNSAIIKSTTTPGVIKVKASAKGIAPVSLTLNSKPVD